MKMMSMGSMLATVAAVARPQSVLYCPGMVAKPGGMVRVVSLVGYRPDRTLWEETTDESGGVPAYVPEERVGDTAV